jgi:PKD repeat protein
MKYLFLSFLLLTLAGMNSCSEPTVACFEHFPETKTINTEVVFNASCSSNSYIFEWTFGDGSDDSITHEPVARHIYSAAGEYVVTLNASRKDGVTLGKNQPRISHRIVVN